MDLHFHVRSSRAQPRSQESVRLLPHPLLAAPPCQRRPQRGAMTRVFCAAGWRQLHLPQLRAADAQGGARPLEARRLVQLARVPMRRRRQRRTERRLVRRPPLLCDECILSHSCPTPKTEIQNGIPTDWETVLLFFLQWARRRPAMHVLMHVLMHQWARRRPAAEHERLECPVRRCPPVVDGPPQPINRWRSAAPPCLLTHFSG